MTKDDEYDHDGPPPSPEPTANFFSRLFFLWVFPLVMKGYRKPLEENDVWALNPKDSAEATTKEFIDVYDTLPKDEPRMVKTLFRISRSVFIYTATLQVVILVLTLASPLVVNRILANVSDVTEPQGPGFIWSAVLFVVVLLRTLVEGHFYVEVARASCKIRASIQSVVYAKSLQLSSSARGGSSVGEISNLMQLDAEALGRFANTIHALWSAPVQLVVSIVLLYLFIGPSSLIGLGFTLITVPLQTFIIKRLFALRRKAMVVTDQRVKLTNEILQGVKAVKFYAWERPFMGKVEETRAGELKLLKSGVILRALFVVVITAMPTLISIVTFTFYISVFGNPLDVASIFTALVLLNQLRQPLLTLPFAVTAIVESKVSIKRIERFLGFESTEPPTRDDPGCKKGEIRIENGSFKWAAPPPKLPARGKKPATAGGPKRNLNPFKRGSKAADEPASTTSKEVPVAATKVPDESEVILQDLNLRIPAGKLTAIIGSVGSGKSSLLNAMLGEMKTVSGKVRRNGTVGYVPQTAWIYNGKLRDNILFGEAFDEERYTAAVAASQLEADIALLPNGHDTTIGEKGVNLSGGQKQRVSIARTIYCDLDIYIFDDPLSALDAHVGAEVFEQCLSKNGKLRGKTRILVTNQLQFLPRADNIIYLMDGEVKNQGTYDELHTTDESFQKLLLDIVSNEEDPNQVSREPTQADQTVQDQEPQAPKTKSALVSKGTLMSMEDRKLGNVQMSVYTTYARQCGNTFFFSIVVFLSVVTATAQVLPNWWLSYWAEEESESPGARTSEFFLGIYFLLGISYVILTFVRSVIFFTIALVAGRTLHENAIKSTLAAPMSFFDVTPIGRILSRFSRDVSNVDQQIPVSFMQMINSVLSLIAAYVMIAVITPLFMAVAIPIGILYYLFQRFYNRTNIELKRLDSISKSPIYAHFAETLGGLSTIRAYNREDRFIEANAHHIDTNIQFFFAQNVTSRWFSMYLEFLGAVLILAAALFGVMGKGRIFSGLVGLSLNYALQVTAFLGFTIRSLTELESQMNAVERLEYYGNQLPKEAPAIVNDYRAPNSWPQKGGIDLQDVKLRYREGLEPALSGVTVKIEPGEKIGVVGRTGAGKSSLMTALLRIVEPYEGKMEIDDVDIRKLGLEDLRSNITIIPQDPVVFSGTLRFNIDPFQVYSDDELWEVLSKASLKPFVTASDQGLEMTITEYGGNLSGGQQQLLCLARALLRRPKILIMDEATSHVDYETDQFVQKTIRKEFADSTILTIAHRLWTVADYDRIMMIKAGEVGEIDTPAALLANNASMLGELVDSMGEPGSSTFRELVLGGSRKGKDL